MTPSVTLPPHISFHELPFCGLLLDTAAFAVYRLSPGATCALRRALRGPLAVGPYESLVVGEPAGAATVDPTPLLRSLAARGLVHVDGGAAPGRQR